MKKFIRNAIKNNKERRLEADISTPTVRSLVSKIDEIPLSAEPIEPINGDDKNKLKK